MTIKELSQFCGKTERTIQLWVKKYNEKISLQNEKISLRKGHDVDLTLEQVECILNNSSMSKDAVAILMQNAKNSSALSNTTESYLSERDIALISKIVSVTVAETIKQLDNRVSVIESRIEKRQALLPPPEITPREHINMLVRKYADEMQDYQGSWNELYRQFAYRTHSNPKLCAKNQGVSVIDYIEAQGQIEMLEAVAIEIFGGEK